MKLYDRLLTWNPITCTEVIGTVVTIISHETGCQKCVGIPAADEDDVTVQFRDESRLVGAASNFKTWKPVL